VFDDLLLVVGIAGRSLRQDASRDIGDLELGEFGVLKALSGISLQTVLPSQTLGSCMM